jgi:hypothetical protein
MRSLGLWILAVFGGFSVFLRRDQSGSAFGAHYLGMMVFLALLVMASEAGADPLFSPPTSYQAGDTPQSVAVADLDGDSLPDLVTANRDSDEVGVLLGNGDGSFQAGVFFAVGDRPRFVAVADPLTATASATSSPPISSATT